MAHPEVNSLCQTLLRLGLCSQPQLDDCLVGPSSGSRDLFLQTLERKGFLTSYQSSQLKKGDHSALVLGHYALLYHNASGSFARVYRCKDMNTGKMLGLKVLRSRFAKDPKAVHLFRREAELGKTLKHENIVPIYEVAQDGAEHYLSMEFVEGGNLRDFLKIRKKLSVEEATKCVLDVAKGLAYALDKGLTHRDLKPTNVLMSSRGVAKLVDFGLAGLDPAGGGNPAKVSEGNQRAIEYATLEKNTGCPRNDPRSDLFFLGAIYYELLTGIPALPRTKDINERAEFANYSNITSICTHLPDIPEGVVATLEKMLTVDPQVRYQKPQEVVEDLLSLMADYSVIPPLAGLTAKSTTMSPGPRATEVSTKAQVVDQLTIMCVESRTKNQEVLRAYFNKHTYRVLMLSDLSRAVQRVETQHPECVIVLEEGVEGGLFPAFSKLVKAVEAAPQLSCILVLQEKSLTDPKAIRISVPERIRVLSQPLSLRELHTTMRDCLRKSGHEPPPPRAKELKNP